MMIENTEFWQDKIRREKSLELLAKYHEYERTHKMSKKLNNSTIVSAKSPERLEEVINELKKNGSI